MAVKAPRRQVAHFDAAMQVAFENWVETLTDEQLECRFGNHRPLGILDKRNSVHKNKGTVIIDGPCERSCGVYIYRYYPKGDLANGYSRYDYSSAPGYLQPREARHRVTRADKAIFLQQALDRRNALAH